MIAVCAGPLAVATLVAAGVVFEDAEVRFEVPEGWTVSGAEGEYLMESEQSVASLLLLPPDPDRPIEVVLAEIEEQFLSTGQIERLGSEDRMTDSDLVRVHRYRFDMANEASAAVLMHQYSFVRSAVHVLLQVETPPEGADPEPLFDTIHGSLEILLAPDLFDEPAEEPGEETADEPGQEPALDGGGEEAEDVPGSGGEAGS